MPNSATSPDATDRPERQRTNTNNSFESNNIGYNNSGTPYEILGIQTNATEFDIRQAYKRRLLETHPDKPHGSRSAFDSVHAAYNELTAPASSLTEQCKCCSDLPPTVIAETVSLYDDMDIFEDENIACYPCRCGDNFELPLSDSIEHASVVVTCNGCSLSIVVEIKES